MFNTNRLLRKFLTLLKKSNKLRKLYKRLFQFKVSFNKLSLLNRLLKKLSRKQTQFQKSMKLKEFKKK